MRRIPMIPLLLFFAASLYGLDPGLVSGGGSAPRSLSFAGAADLAVAYSADLRHAYASQGLKERSWVLGLRAYFPRLSLSVSENDRLQAIGADSFLKNYTLNLDQLLWDGGRTSMSRKLERMEIDLSHSRLERMSVDIAEAAIGAYRNVLSSRAVLEIRETALLALKEQRRILNEELALGLALPVDLARADLSLAEAELELISIRSDLAEIEQQFAELLGLESLPVLEEKVDINRAAILPAAAAAGALAEERNPDLAEARFSIIKKQGELKYTSHSWIPTLRLTGGFGLSGQIYPLTRYNWSVGINIEFSSPWFQNGFAVQAGWEPPYDKTVQLQNKFTPLPDPAGALTKRQAMLALALEREKYDLAFERTGRTARRAVEKCSLIDSKRILAVEAIALAAERCRLEELRLSLGQITRIDLMETYIEYTQKEIAAVEAAAALLEAERELERFLDLRPGELAVFAASSAGQETLMTRSNL
jgi:outer membrane protein TolC